MGKRPSPKSSYLDAAFPWHPRRDYARHRDAIERIFTSSLPEWSRSSQRAIQTTIGIPYQRLYSWKRKWEQDPTWRSWRFQPHGTRHRVFSFEEERGIADYNSNADL
jgi:hypothetical protein